MSGRVPGSESVQLLASALVDRLGERVVRWVGWTPPGDDEDAIGWRLASAPRFLFSASTHAGRLPDGKYDLQVSIVDDTMENGEIVFLDDVVLREVCELTARLHRGEDF